MAPYANQCESSYEKAFYPQAVNIQSYKAIKWLENESQKRKIHIHHLRCGHGGERYIKVASIPSAIPVDGYCSSSKTVFQFNGCYCMAV